MNADSNEYTPEKVTCHTGKIVKWSGKEVACGQWPEEGTGGYRFGIYQTKPGT